MIHIFHNGSIIQPAFIVRPEIMKEIDVIIHEKNKKAKDLRTNFKHQTLFSPNKVITITSYERTLVDLRTKTE